MSMAANIRIEISLGVVMGGNDRDVFILLEVEGTTASVLTSSLRRSCDEGANPGRR